MKQRNLLFIIATVILMLGVVYASDAWLQPAIASKILRFHVIANSDSACDQEIKIKVRDAVGAFLQPMLSDASGLEETKQIVEANMDKIKDISEATLRENGCNHMVALRIAKTDFPEKSYGSYTFPEGSYEALQIVIGEGDGQNWWCVLYPNMCFRGSVYEVVEESAEEALKEVLSPWEYAKVFDSGKVKIRFKFLEFLYGSEL